MTLMLVTAAVVLLMLNLWATQAVLGDPLSSAGQRSAQLLFVWLLPFAGALLTLHLKRREAERASGRYRDIPDPGNDFGMSARHARCNDDRDGDAPDGASHD